MNNFTSFFINISVFCLTKTLLFFIIILYTPKSYSKRADRNMAKRNVAVLCFGTSRISVIIGERGINNTFDVRGFGEMNYAGFMDGQFLELDRLPDNVRAVVAMAENNARCKITDLYVGVPAEFCVSAVRSSQRNFPKKHKINDQDIEAMYNEADEFSASTTHSVINRSPIYFTLDDNRRVVDPKGVVTTKIGAMFSFVLAERDFLSIISSILEPLKIKFVDYISEPLAESLYLIDPSDRDACAILVDCGYLTTSVSVVMGDGLVSLNSFSLGGGHIVSDLVDQFDIPFGIAEQLKRKVVLSFQPEKGDYYEILQGEREFKVDAGIANAVVASRVTQISKMVAKCLSKCKFEYPDYIPILITGGGICYLKGARDLMSKVLGKDVRIVAPSVPQLDKPHVSSLLGLLDVGLKQSKVNNAFFSKLFKI